MGDKSYQVYIFATIIHHVHHHTVNSFTFSSNFIAYFVITVTLISMNSPSYQTCTPLHWCRVWQNHTVIVMKFHNITMNTVILPNSSSIRL
jgi:hypothetical protein